MEHQTAACAPAPQVLGTGNKTVKLLSWSMLLTRINRLRLGYAIVRNALMFGYAIVRDVLMSGNLIRNYI